MYSHPQARTKSIQVGCVCACLNVQGAMNFQNKIGGEKNYSTSKFAEQDNYCISSWIGLI